MGKETATKQHQMGGPCEESESAAPFHLVAGHSRLKRADKQKIFMVLRKPTFRNASLISAGAALCLAACQHVAAVRSYLLR